MCAWVTRECKHAQTYVVGPVRRNAPAAVDVAYAADAAHGNVEDALSSFQPVI